MDVIRRWIFRPKKTDTSLLAQFFYADRDLNLVADQLEKFDGHKNVEQFTSLLTDLRKNQDIVLSIIEKIMDVVIPESRASRDFRVKFPDDILQESLSGRLWFGAECLAAGSSIINHEVESLSMQPLAKQVTRHLARVRTLLRDQSLRSTHEYSVEIRVALLDFDNLFAEFELCYVSAMVPVKTMNDYDRLQDVTVLFSEAVQRSLRLGWLSQEQLDMYEPALMFTIPRLAVICGLLVYPEGPLNPDMNPNNMSEMFRPFQLLLHRIRDLLWTLEMKELWILEMLLSKGKDPSELDGLVCFEDLNCPDCPWLSDTYSCGAIAERTRCQKDSSNNRCSTTVSKAATALPVTSEGCDVVAANGYSEISEFFQEVVRSCGHDDQQNLYAVSVLGPTMQDPRSSESVANSDIISSNDVTSNDGGEIMTDHKTNIASITSYDSSPDNCRTPRTDPNLLSSQVTSAVCVSDCSSVHQISCGCQGVPDQSLYLESHGCEILDSSVPANTNMTEKTEGLSQVGSVENEQAKEDCGKQNQESESADVSFCDSLEVSQRSCHHDGAGFDYDWDRESYVNYVSNSNSLCCDDIDEAAMKLAIEVAESTAREEMRSQFRDSMDLIHRLFVCISGIADQLQTNFASDLRRILKAVFDCHTSPELSPKVTTKAVVGISDIGDLAPVSSNPDTPFRIGNNDCSDRPRWIPDDESPYCTSCQAAFTFMRRRHHCRNCGKVFCGQCSSNTVPLPHYGHEKPVRVCNHCFLFCVTPFRLGS